MTTSRNSRALFLVLTLAAPLAAESFQAKAPEAAAPDVRLAVPETLPAPLPAPDAFVLPAAAESSQNGPAPDAPPETTRENLARLDQNLAAGDQKDPASQQKSLDAGFDKRHARYYAHEEDGVISIRSYHLNDDEHGADALALAGALKPADDRTCLGPDLPPDCVGDMSLHMHSEFSDGTMAPEAIVEAAYKKGVRKISLTDHDTTAGVLRAAKKARELGMEFYAGVEMTARGGAHIGGLGVDINNPTLVALLARVRQARWVRARAIINHLNELKELRDNPITMNEVEAKSRHQDGGTIELPHIARVLMDKGLIKSVDEAFQTYLKGDIAGKSGAEPDPTPQEVIDAIHAAGGLAILNHPYTVSAKRTGDRAKDEAAQDAAIERIIALGLDGIEAYRPSNATSDRGKQAARARVMKYLGFAKKHGLFAAPGADFHGTDTHLDHMVVMMPKDLMEETLARLNSRRRIALLPQSDAENLSSSSAPSAAEAATQAPRTFLYIAAAIVVLAASWYLLVR